MSEGPAFFDDGSALEPTASIVWVLVSSSPEREVLVQLDDDLVDHLDQLAKTLGTNRSELLRRGAQAVIDAEETLAADRDLVAAYRRQPPEPAVVRSAARLAARTAPEW